MDLIWYQRAWNEYNITAIHQLELASITLMFSKKKNLKRIFYLLYDYCIYATYSRNAYLKLISSALLSNIVTLLLSIILARFV